MTRRRKFKGEYDQACEMDLHRGQIIAKFRVARIGRSGSIRAWSLRHANKGSHSPPGVGRKAQQSAERRDQRIAPVFQIEFESLGWKYCRASPGAGMPPCKRQRGAFEQENSAALALDVAGEPEAVSVAADEKCRDRLVDDSGIERLKRRGDLRGFAAGQDAGGPAILRGRCG